MKTINSIIATLYYTLFFLTPLIMFSLTSELFEFNKMLLIYLITSILVSLWIIKMIIQKKIIIKRTPIDIPIILFFISQILSTFFSIDKHTSFYGYYGRFNGGLLSIISYILLFYCYVSNINYKTTIKLLKISLVSSFLVILWGIPGKFGKDFSCYLFTGQLTNSCWTNQFKPAERMFSTLGQPNWLGAYLSINFFIGLYFYFSTKFHQKILKNKKILLLIYLFLNFSIVLFTRSRSALLTIVFNLLILSIILILNYFYKQISKKNITQFNFLKTKDFLLILTILMATTIVFKTGINKIDSLLKLPPKQNQIIKPTNKLQNNKNKSLIKITDSFTIRKIVWQGAIDLLKKYPLFGSGVETFAYSYYFVRPKIHNNTSEWDYLYNKAHNEFLNYVATTGYFGILSYLLLILFVLGLFIKNIINNKKESKILIFLLLSYLSILITNFFGFSTTTINIFFYLIPGFILALINKKSDEQQPTNKLNTTNKILITLIIVINLNIIFNLTKYFVADIKFNQGKNFQHINDFQKSAINFQQALNLHYEHVYEDKLSYTLANLAFMSDYQKNPSQTKELIKLAKSYNQHSLKKSPYNVLYWKTKAKNQYIFYQINLDQQYLQKGLNALKQAQKLSPTDPKIPYSLGLFYSLIEDTQKNNQDKFKYKKLALSSVQKAINLKPDYRDPYFLKAQLYIKYNQKQKAKKILQEILNKINPNDKQTKEELKKL